MMEFKAFMADHEDLTSQVNLFLNEVGKIKIKNIELTSVGERNEDGLPVLALVMFYE